MPFINRRRIKVSSEIPTASMADIAFLLMIFFLVTTTFPKERGLAVVLPEQGIEAQVSQANLLHLVVQPDGVVEVRRGESQQVQRLDAREIEAVWRDEVTANPDVVASVRTHPAAPYRYMLDVLDALQAANAERISLQVLEP